MEKGDLLKKLEKPVKHARTKHNALGVGEINDFLTGDNLSLERMDQIYSYLEGRSTGVVPVLDEAMLTEDTILLDDIDLDLDLDDDSFIKGVEEKEIGLDAVGLLEGIGTEDPVRMCLKEVGIVPLLMTDEELDLAQCKADGDEFAKERLIEASLRLVVSATKRYTGRGMSFLDLVQGGNLGLVKGMEKFGYTKGYELGIYATRQTRQSVARTLANQTRTVRVPVHMVETTNETPKMQGKLTLELDYEPFITELVEALDMTEDRVMEIIQIAREPASPETPIGEEDDSNLGDFVAGNNVMTPEGNVEFIMLWGHIDAPLGDLKEREYQVIVLRFGLEDGHLRILGEVGKEFNVTREHIRQIEAEALRRLHNPMRSKRTRDFPQALPHKYF